jgi:tetratricopeptide (TPR) repeat protein
MKASETASHLRASDPQPYRWNAEARLARLDAAGALKQVGGALRLSPEMPEALALAARAYALQADWASAERYAQMSQSADPLAQEGDLAMGYVLLSENRPQDALKAFLQAQRVSAQPAEAITGQGRCYSALGDRSKALTTFKTALENDPRFAPAHLYAGNALTEMGRWDEALSEYSQAVALRPRWPEALYYQGRAFVQREDLRNGAAAFKKATDQSPNLTDAWYGLGIADRGLGDQKGAIEALSAVTKLNPNHGEAWLYLGLTYEEVGDRVSARQAFENAVTAARLESTRSQAQQGLQRVR